jgi:hypothetical protein
VVTHTTTWLHGLDIPLVPMGEGHVDLEIDSLNLLPGRYLVSLLLNSCLRQHTYDLLENPVHLDVEEAPIYGSTRHIDSRYGLVFFPQRWRLEGIGSRTVIDLSSAAHG